MPVTLAQLQDPIDWQKPEFKPMLKDLQANILKGHGRPATRNVFLTVKAGQAVAARTGLAKLAPLVTDALSQLEATIKFQQTGEGGGTVILAFLSRAGYKALGAKAVKIPTDAAFGAGMGDRQDEISDPPRSAWHAGFKKVPHAMILIADSSQALCEVADKDIRTKLGTAGWTVSHVETGAAIFDDQGRGLEHFGYMDGRSQPLMLTADVEGERPTGGALFKWNPSFGPDIALTKDPAGTGPDSFGSYFIFRKLEQDVVGFRSAEKGIADARLREAAKQGLIIPIDPEKLAEAREIAGAMIVGRFEDGTPVIEDGEAQNASDPPNNFNYDDDPDGRKCPLHAHIRKTNPRKDNMRAPIMPRRGITYGGSEGSGADVGLLFMAYNVNLTRQFEFTQKSWANDANFIKLGTGIDPIIGQGPLPRPPYKNCPIAHGDNRRHKGDFQQFVTMRGGEYFFAPSISGLKNLV